MAASLECQKPPFQCLHLQPGCTSWGLSDYFHFSCNTDRKCWHWQSLHNSRAFSLFPFTPSMTLLLHSLIPCSNMRLKSSHTPASSSLPSSTSGEQLKPLGEFPCRVWNHSLCVFTFLSPFSWGILCSGEVSVSAPTSCSDVASPAWYKSLGPTFNPESLGQENHQGLYIDTPGSPFNQAALGSANQQNLRNTECSPKQNKIWNYHWTAV